MKFVLFLCQLCLNIKIFLKKFYGTIEVLFFRVVLNLNGTKKFQARPKFFIVIDDPFIFAYNSFFDPLIATGMALFVNLGLSHRLSGIIVYSI